MADLRALRTALGQVPPEGIRPIPVEAGTKRPTVEGWPTLWDDDPERARHLVERHHGSIGIVLGPPGPVALDLDYYRPGGEQAMFDLDERFDLDGTLRQWSGGGGEHRLYYPADCALGHVDLGPLGYPHCEYRGVGCLLLVAPSLHPSGDRYRFDFAEMRRLDPTFVDWLEVEGGHGYPGATKGSRAHPANDEVVRLLVERFGGHTPSTNRDGSIDLRRPGNSPRDRGGVTVGGHRAGVAHVWSTDWPGLAAGGNYNSDELRQLAEGNGAVILRSSDEATPLDDAGASQRPAHGLRVLSMATVEARPIRWLWRGWMERGVPTLLDGDPGLGKSAIAVDLVASVTTGRALPDGTAPEVNGPCVILTGEESATILQARLSAADADLGLVHFLDGSFLDDSELTLPAHLDALGSVVAEVGAVLLVVDVLPAFLDDALNSYSDKEVRRALRPLSRWADRAGVAVLLLRHLRKSGATKSVHGGTGSVAFTAVARSQWVVGFDPNDEAEDPAQRLRVLAVSKINNAPLPPGRTYRIEGQPVLTGDQMPRIRWGDGIHVDPNRLTSGDPSPRARELASMDASLSGLLADGPVTTSAVEGVCNLHGWSMKQGRAALHRLGAVTLQRDRQWWWLLGDDDDHDE